MLPKRFTEDRTGVLTEISDVSMCKRAALFKSVERMSRDHPLPTSLRPLIGRYVEQTR